MKISTILVRKAIDYDRLLADTKGLLKDFGSKPEEVEIEKVIEMSKEDFEEFKSNLLKDRDFMDENREFTSFLVKEKGTKDEQGIIVYTDGGDYPRHTGIYVR